MPLNAVDILLIAAIVCCCALALRSILKNRKKGGCGCGCEGCTAPCSALKDADKKHKETP